MASAGFTIAVSRSCPVKSEYVLGLLNSTLLFWRLKQTSNIFRGGWITCTKQYVGELPIRSIDFSVKAEAAQHDRVVGLVTTMLALVKNNQSAKLPQEQNRLQREIDATDRQIDRLVYELYGLTDDEIRIVEEAMK
jgi:hypothetical protein